MEDGEDTSFLDWLGNRLKALQTDENVFSPYISSILEDEDEPDKVEALDGILRELGNGIDAELLRDEILYKWRKHKMYLLDRENAAASLVKSNQDYTTTQTDTLGDQLGKIFRNASESAESLYAKKNTESDVKLRAAILSKQESESEGGEDEPSSSSTKKQVHDSDGPLSAEFGRNMNLEKVLNEQRDKKEKSREESAKKKEKDKEDRVKQKKDAQDRKDKAKKKTAKVERKR